MKSTASPTLTAGNLRTASRVLGSSKTHNEVELDVPARMMTSGQGSGLLAMASDAMYDSRRGRDRQCGRMTILVHSNSIVWISSPFFIILREKKKWLPRGRVDGLRYQMVPSFFFSSFASVRCGGHGKDGVRWV